MSAIRVQNLTKNYGETVALQDVSFEIEEGEFAIVLGVSGSGKSTLLRCINGLTPVTSGEIYVHDDPVRSARKDVAMVFQQHNVIEQMSAYSNALTGALGRTEFLRSLFRFHGKEDKLRALEALEMVGLLDEAEQRAGRMSGGQMQRVGIARALVQEPRVMLADEPVASLDPGSSQSVMGYLRTAAEERNLTTLISLHQVNLARMFGERFLGLRDGELVFDGYSDDLTFDVIDDLYGGIDMDELLGRDEEPRAGAEEAAS